LVDEKQFFANLGERVKALRKSKGLTQEDMIGFGFSARHWQQIEAGRPITLTTLLRICDAFSTRAGQLIDGLDRGIYRK
jgi:transcriptional regulator with XRE-family HTH domain